MTSVKLTLTSYLTNLFRHILLQFLYRRLMSNFVCSVLSFLHQKEKKRPNDDIFSLKFSLRWVQIRKYSINKAKAHKGLRCLYTERYPDILCQLGQCDLYKVTSQHFLYFYGNRLFSYKYAHLFNIKNHMGR